MKKPQKTVKADPELSASFMPSPTLTNRFYMAVTEGMVRLAFGEQGLDLGVRYHTALVLSPQNALALADLLRANIKLAAPGEEAGEPPAPKTGGGLH